MDHRANAAPAYRPALAISAADRFAGVPVQRYTRFLDHDQVLKVGSALDPETASVYIERFRDPVVARTARDTYRTFPLREMPRGARHPEKRRATVPIRALFGVNDTVIQESFMAPETANADDFTLEKVEASHFIIDERPDLVRSRLVALAQETSA